MFVFYSFLFYLIIFSAYLELGNGLGNVWYRIGVDGYRHIRFSHLFTFIMKPFSMIELWYPQNWDINYFAGATIFTFLFKNLINIINKYNTSYKRN